MRWTFFQGAKLYTLVIVIIGAFMCFLMMIYEHRDALNYRNGQELEEAIRQRENWVPGVAVVLDIFSLASLNYTVNHGPRMPTQHSTNALRTFWLAYYRRGHWYAEREDFSFSALSESQIFTFLDIIGKIPGQLDFALDNISDARIQTFDEKTASVRSYYEQVNSSQCAATKINDRDVQHEDVLLAIIQNKLACDGLEYAVLWSSPDDQQHSIMKLDYYQRHNNLRASQLRAKTNIRTLEEFIQLSESL